MVVKNSSRFLVVLMARRAGTSAFAGRSCSTAGSLPVVLRFPTPRVSVQSRNMWRWPIGGKSVALVLNLPGSIPGHGPIFRVALALFLFHLQNLNGILSCLSLAFNIISCLLWDIRCLLYTSPSPRDLSTSRMPSSA